jgi:hypothetical protein
MSNLPSEIGSDELPTADQVRTLIKTREQPPSALLKRLATELRNTTKNYVEIDSYLLTQLQTNYLIEMLEDKGFSVDLDNGKIRITW